MAIDDTYRLTVRMTWLGQQFINTYAFNAIAETAVTNADATALAVDAKDAFRAINIPTVTYSSWRLTQLRGTGVTPVQGECRTEGGQAFEGLYTTNTAGTGSSGDALPPQCALVITLNTGFIGRRRRGRLYVPGFAETDQAAGTFTGTLITAATTAWNVFFNKYAGATPTSPLWRLGVWSYRIATGCVPGPPPNFGHVQVDPPNLADAFRPCTAYALRSTVYTQRRRVIGVGR